MLECINKECVDNKNGKCENKLVLNNSDCLERIKPTHTPTYAEEQLNYAIEKENKNCPNWEEEYHKLKKENEELQKELKDIKHIYYNSDISGVKEGLENIIDSLKLKAAVTEKLEIEINNLNEIIERKDKEINDLQISHNIIEQENNKLKEKKESTIRNDYESENKALRCQYEEAKRYIEVKETEMQNLKKKLEDAELLGKMIKRLVEGL